MIRIIDLFAGIGGIRLGFEQAFQKVDCVFSSEIDRHAIQTYKANFNDEYVHGDITEIDERDIPPHDILLAGFPCQPFSQAGLKKGFEDTRGTLFFDIARILKFHKPKAFLLENVKLLKGHDRGETLKTMLNALEEIGYKNVSYKILRARDFGVPQNRERIYIVGFLNNKTLYQFPKPLNIRTKVGDILDKKVHEKYTISDKLWSGHQRRKVENKKKGKGFGYGLFNAESEYTNTLSARYYKDGSEILIYQGESKNPRKITPREAARLQGFPEGYKIVASDTQAYKQFGNSVCVPIIKNLAESIKKVL